VVKANPPSWQNESKVTRKKTIGPRVKSYEERCCLCAASPSAKIPAMPNKLSPAARARKIKLLLFDVDGVLTDGKLFIFPAPAGSQQSILEQSAKHGGEGGFGLHSQSLIEAKGFHAHDGTSISLARMAGIKTGIITKRISETVALRARDLKLEHVHQGVDDKATW